jgi:hypothetical protein
MSSKELSQSSIAVTEREGYEVGYSGKADNRNPYAPGQLHDIWQEHYERGVAQRQKEYDDAEASSPWKKSLAA